MLSNIFNNYTVNLVETVEELKDLKTLIEKSPTALGVDTETTGLIFGKDKIVGICLSVGLTYSIQDYQGYYLPVRHNNYENLPLDKVLALTQDILNNHTTWFFNRSFDVQMLEQEGIEIPLPDLHGTNDAQILVYLANQEARPALKDSAAKYLNWEVIKLASQFEEGNIDPVNADPRQFYIYAAGDALLTVFLAQHLWNAYPYIRKIYSTIDNYSGEAIRYLCNNKLYVDIDLAEEMCKERETKVREVEEAIYDFVGVRFNMNSTKPKIEAFSRYCTLTKRSASGKSFSTDVDVLDDLRKTFPGTPVAELASLMLEYSELTKELSTYLRKMKKFPKDGFRVNYNACLTTTGRLSSGGGNAYFVNLSIQNIPKVEVKLHVHPDERFGLIANEIEEGSLGKAKNKAGIRSLFIAPPGFSWMSYDYSAMEFRIAAIYANEKVWIDAIKNGEDLHMKTAEQIFHVQDESSRTKIKCINFGTLYGMSINTMAKMVGVTTQEAKKIYNLWLTSLPGIATWLRTIELQALSTGIVFTSFGRPRNLEKYLKSPDSGLRAFGLRCAVNSPIQGLGADICRVDLFKVLLEVRNNKDFRENCFLCNTVHDELNFYVRDCYRKEADNIIRKFMTVQLPSWPIPLDVEASIGQSWGAMVPFTANMMGQDGRLTDFIH
jgi:DNA polymerase-1